MRLSQRFHSPALDAPLAYSVYLPPDAEGIPGATFPVVYLLHGVGDNERSYPRAGDVEATMDRLIAAGEITPMIVVMPAAKRSWYVDNAGRGGAGNYETAIMRDLVGHVDRTYPAESSAAGRFITGHSMGGFGALRLAFKFPERFAAVAAMSAALWDRVDSGFELPEDKQGIFAGAFGDPFDPERFMAAHPRAYLPALKDCGCAPPVYLTSGDDDYFRAYVGTFRLFTDLREAGLTTELRITDGGHAWKLWRETALPNVLRWFSRQYRQASPERPRDNVQTEGEQGAE
ncbi:MAG: alpha/beta hydrolase [Dichotomicrobium sp.]